MGLSDSALVGAGHILISQEPLDYASALRIFRDMLHTPWKRFSGKHPLDDMQLNYTLHSAKATLLSFGPQLGSAVDSDDRLQQGHHADPRKSLQLYGSDSVWGALRCQQTVVQKIRTGFRPKTAQHRGGQKPLVELHVHLEFFKKQAAEYVYQYLPFSAPNPTIEVDEAPLTEEISSSSSSSSDGSSQPNDEVEVKDKSATFAGEVILAKHRRVTHAMVVQNSEALLDILKSIGVRHVVLTCHMMIPISSQSGATICLFANIQAVRKLGLLQECFE